MEHDAEFSAAIQRQVAACGLSELVQFLHAPLHDGADEPPARSYDLRILPDMQVDLALIDGPPLPNGGFTRLAPLRWAARHLKPDGVIFLDDSMREAEQACLKQLALEHPNRRSIPRASEKGLTELRFLAP